MDVTISLELLLTVLLGVGGIAVAWGVMRSSVVSLERQFLDYRVAVEKRMSGLEERIDDHDDTLKTVTRMETELKHVSEELRRITQFFERVRFGAAKQ